jgi:hypothetical protein
MNRGACLRASQRLGIVVSLSLFAALAACEAQSNDGDSNGADLAAAIAINPTAPDPFNRWMKGVDPATLGIGEEVVLPDEAASFATIGDAVHAMQDALAKQNGGVNRFVHVKSPMCALGEFSVHVPSSHPEARVGLFAKDASFPAWVRFSNGLSSPHSDSTVDSRGLAVKVMKVPGSKVTPGAEDAGTQDLLATNFITQPAPDADAFLRLFRASADAIVAGNDPTLHLLGDISTRFGGVNFGPWNRLLVTGGFLFRPENARTLSTLLTQTVPQILKNGSLLEETYFSGAPIAMGLQSGDPLTARANDAAKFRMVPGIPQDGRCVQVSKLPNFADDNYLRADIKQILIHGPACIDVQLQFQRKPATQVIEDSSVVWPESDSPYVSVASITVPQMDLDSPQAQEKMTFCQSLSFSPWHALREHRPLGNVMRARRFAYEASRLHRGGAAEPTGDEFP